MYPLIVYTPMIPEAGGVGNSRRGCLAKRDGDKP
jgi:hypothetical protein